MSADRKYLDGFIPLPFTDYLVLRRKRSGRPATNVPHILERHSPTGFEWGYGGSGPADLALNIVEQTLRIMGYQGPKSALLGGFVLTWTLYQSFKWEFIARAPEQGTRIPFSTLETWIRLNLPEDERSNFPD